MHSTVLSMAAAAPLYQFCCSGQLWLQGFSQILHINVVYLHQAGETALTR